MTLLIHLKYLLVELHIIDDQQVLFLFISILFIDPFQGGKGRTGTFIASWLLITDFCPSADVALRHFGERRTDESKGTAFQGEVLFFLYSSRLK